LSLRLRPTRPVRRRTPPAPAPRRPLRVPPPSQRRRRRSRRDWPLRLALWTTVVLTVGTIFGAAAFHVLLVQSQFRLDRLEKKAAAEQQHYERLRLEVSRLAAPERIVEEAKQRLGMVVPPAVSYVLAPAPVGEEPALAPLERGWSKVKPSLDAQR
jgi:cell division protein FtsL